MKFLIAGLLLAMIVGLGTQVKEFSKRKSDAKKAFESLNEKFEQAKADQEELEAELRYLSNPANIEKELRARFNFRAPGENLIIIVPRAGSSSRALP